MNFEWLRVGPFFEESELFGMVLGRKPKTSKVPVVSILRCELEDFQLSMEEAHIANGRVVIRDSTLRDSSLRIELAESRHPSLLVRCIDEVDSVVDIPVEPEVWAH
jgi:hypothetical protein